MNREMRIPQPLLRECISNSDDELVIFGADNFSQFPRRNGSIRSSCDRALPGVSFADLVVLGGDQNCEYYNCNAIESNGSFSIILISEGYNHLVHLEKSLHRIGINRA